MTSNVICTITIVSLPPVRASGHWSTHLDPGIEALAPGALKVLLRLEDDLVERADRELGALLGGVLLGRLWPQLGAAAVRVGLAAQKDMSGRSAMLAADRCGGTECAPLGQGLEKGGGLCYRVVLLQADLDARGRLAQRGIEHCMR